MFYYPYGKNVSYYHIDQINLILNPLNEYFSSELKDYMVLRKHHRCGSSASCSWVLFDLNGSKACAASSSRVRSACGKWYTQLCVVIKMFKKSDDRDSAFWEIRIAWFYHKAHNLFLIGFSNGTGCPSASLCCGY